MLDYVRCLWESSNVVKCIWAYVNYVLFHSIFIITYICTLTTTIITLWLSAIHQYQIWHISRDHLVYIIYDDVHLNTATSSNCLYYRPCVYTDLLISHALSKTWVSFFYMCWITETDCILCVKSWEWKLGFRLTVNSLQCLRPLSGFETYGLVPIKTTLDTLNVFSRRRWEDKV